MEQNTEQIENAETKKVGVVFSHEDIMKIMRNAQRSLQQYWKEHPRTPRVRVFGSYR